MGKRMGSPRVRFSATPSRTLRHMVRLKEVELRSHWLVNAEGKVYSRVRKYCSAGFSKFPPLILLMIRADLVGPSLNPHRTSSGFRLACD
jgi:hypothetical protein